MNKTFSSLAILASLTARLKTLEAKIERFTEYLKRDDFLLENSKYPQKYKSRRKNHADKLARYIEQAEEIRIALTR
jgi:hypothetical protein